LAQRPLALIMMDVDYFKHYNDTYGHLRGDQCLKKIAQAIKKALARSGDIVARYGGEEFAVILPNTEEAGAGIVAEKIRKEIEGAKLITNSSPVGEVVTCSLGVAAAVPAVSDEAADSVEVLLSAADKALYRAKNGGRNRVCRSSGLEK
jgi:diguanylate cyclase (GGDEF)-like protein